ncbi:MAG: hypothetical protein AAGJ10_08575 [Bacteroidota bacterium]
MRHLFFLAVGMTLFGCASSAPPLATQFMHTPLTIDGDEADWSGMLAPMPDEDRNLAFAAVSDGQDLYIAFATSDQQTVGQILAMGLTLWFDPDGGTAKTVGLRFPVGLGENSLQALMRAPRDRPRDQQMEELFTASTAALEVLRDGAEDGQRFRPGDVRGLDVSASLTMGTLFYELRFPLKSDSSTEVAIELAEGAMLGFGMETRELDRAALRDLMMEQRGGGRPDRGAGGGMMAGGGMPGAGAMGGGARRPSMPKQLKIWRQIDVYGVAKTER